MCICVIICSYLEPRNVGSTRHKTEGPPSSQAGVLTCLHPAGWYQSGESKHFIILSWQAFFSWFLYFLKFVSPTIALGLESIGSVIALMPSVPNLQSDSRNIFNSNPSAFPPVCPTNTAVWKEITSVSWTHSKEGPDSALGKKNVSLHREKDKLCLISALLWALRPGSEKHELKLSPFPCELSNGQLSWLARKHSPGLCNAQLPRREGLVCKQKATARVYVKFPIDRCRNKATSLPLQGMSLYWRIERAHMCSCRYAGYRTGEYFMTEETGL